MKLGPVNLLNTLDNKDIGTGLSILIINAGRKPPHLIILFEQKIYQLTVKGGSIGDFNHLNQMINQKNIPCLFIKIKNIQTNDMHAYLSDKLDKYLPVNGIDSTCLLPIKDLLSKFYNINTNKINLIFDLIPLLQEAQLIEKFYGCNIGLDAQHYFELEYYTLDDIILASKTLKMNV